MSIPTDIYTLHEVRGREHECLHHLLVRIHQPEFSNADQSDEDRLLADVERRRHLLIEVYRRDVLARECNASHEITPVGELQGFPTGDDLAEVDGDRLLDLWIADTRYGAPWIVLGTAMSEEEFWREIEDSDLLSLGPIRPARRSRVYFVAEKSDS